MAYAHGDYAGEFKKRAGVLWDAAVNYAATGTDPPTRPYQVELHLAGEREKGCCLLRCVDCHGQFLRRQTGMPRRDWLRLLHDLRWLGVPSIVYAGAYSDPCLDEELLAECLLFGAELWGVKLHCYGLSLSPIVAESVATAALRPGTPDNYVTVSKVTTSPDVYDRMCRPYNMTPEHALRQEEEGLARLFDAMERTGWPCAVTLNCRLTKINAGRYDLADLLRWFKTTPARVRMRFTTDYTPSKATPQYLAKFSARIYLSPEEASHRLWKALAESGCPMDRVSFRAPDREPRYDGDRCYNSLLLAAVATDGGVYPCQSVASPANDGLCYGDVKSRGFGEIWVDYVCTWHDREQPRDRGCPSCTAACEAQLNEELRRDRDARV
jgi:hypothetical protein